MNLSEQHKLIAVSAPRTQLELLQDNASQLMAIARQSGLDAAHFITPDLPRAPLKVQAVVSWQECELDIFLHVYGDLQYEFTLQDPDSLPEEEWLAWLTECKGYLLQLVPTALNLEEIRDPRTADLRKGLNQLLRVPEKQHNAPFYWSLDSWFDSAMSFESPSDNPLKPGECAVLFEWGGSIESEVEGHGPVITDIRPKGATYVVKPGVVLANLERVRCPDGANLTERVSIAIEVLMNSVYGSRSKWPEASQERWVMHPRERSQERG